MKPNIAIMNTANAAATAEAQRKVFERINWSWRIDPAGRCSDLIRSPDDGAGGAYCCARRMNPEPLTL